MYKNTGLFLKEKRTQKGLSQPALAEKLGNVHSQFVSNWERGLCTPPAHSYKKLIKVLAIDRHELIKILAQDTMIRIGKRI